MSIKIKMKCVVCIQYADFHKLAMSVISDAIASGDLHVGQIMASGIPKVEADNLGPFVEWFQGEFILEDIGLPRCFIIECQKLQWVVSGLDCSLFSTDGKGAV